MAGPIRYWLAKSEATCYSIDDLKKDKRTSWDGIRNYQARNYMRDDMKVGDLVLFYHSNADPPGIAGVAKVCKAAHPDVTALDPKEQHYDPKSTKEEPIWVMVDLSFEQKFSNYVPLDAIKTDAFDGLLVIKRGQRLSVMPVEKKHFDMIVKLGGGK